MVIEFAPASFEGDPLFFPVVSVVVVVVSVVVYCV